MPLAFFALAPARFALAPACCSVALAPPRFVAPARSVAPACSVALSEGDSFVRVVEDGGEDDEVGFASLELVDREHGHLISARQACLEQGAEQVELRSVEGEDGHAGVGNSGDRVQVLDDAADSFRLALVAG